MPKRIKVRLLTEDQFLHMRNPKFLPAGRTKQIEIKDIPGTDGGIFKKLAEEVAASEDDQLYSN